jgi:cysteine-rich repeat protein
MLTKPSGASLIEIFGRCLALCGLAASAANACGNGPIVGNLDGGQAGIGGSAGSGGTAGGPGGYGGQWPPPCNRPAWCSECGNGIVVGGESCDDGNTVSGDGCGRLCQVEANWQCFTFGTCQKSSLCGDGEVTSDETCDDGNTDSGDGCSGDCRSIEAGWYCPAPGRACRLDRRSALPIDPGTGCDADGGSCELCGNGIVDLGEECDDGSDPSDKVHNQDGVYGGCTTTCKLGPYCGDGMVNGREECDLANSNGYIDRGGIPGDPSYCSFACTLVHYCGDGIPDGDLGEECDLGAQNGEYGQHCDRDCKYFDWGECLMCL